LTQNSKIKENRPNKSNPTIRDFFRILRVSSFPSANVYIDGKLVSGETPFNTEIEKGRHKIELKKEGYQPVQEDIHISENIDLIRKLVPIEKSVKKRTSQETRQARPKQSIPHSLVNSHPLKLQPTQIEKPQSNGKAVLSPLVPTVKEW
jgi:hypothetical protein